MRLLGLVAVLIALWLVLKRMGQGATPASPNAPLGSPAPLDTPVSEEASSDALDSISNAMAQFEGFYKPGSLAQRTNNPGDIGTYGGKVTSFPDVGDGWDRLNGYITSHASAHPDWDFYDFVRYYLTGDTMGQAGPGQDPDAYAEYVAQSAGFDPTQTVASALGIGS